MRIVQLLTLTSLLTTCQTRNDELTGHWHSNTLKDGSHWTLDVTDSTTQVNKYTGGYIFNRFNDKGEEVIVFGFEEVSDFQLRNDTLLISDNLYFIKSEETRIIEHLFPNSLVKLNLPKSTGNSKIKLPRPSQQAHLYIGLPYELDKSYYYNADSTCFQMNDLIATELIDLEYFVRQEDDKLANTENNWLIIHADSSTSQATIDTLLSVMEPLDILNGYIFSSYNYVQNELEYEELTVGNIR